MIKRSLEKALQEIDPEIIDEVANEICKKHLETEAAKAKTVKFEKRIILIAAAAALAIAAVMIPLAVMMNRAPGPATQPPFATNSEESKTENEKQTTPTEAQPGTPTYDPTEKNEVLTVNQSSFGCDLINRFDVDSKPIVFTDEEKLNNQKTVTFLGNEYHIEYKDTVKYLMGDAVVDEYLITGTDNGRVLLCSDDSIYAILGETILTLDIDKNAEKETVLEKLKNALASELDFSRFEYNRCISSLEGTDADSFGMYRFTWFNKIGELEVDTTISVSVLDSGEVGGLWMRDAREYDFIIDKGISIDDYREIIDDKVQEIFSELEDHHLVDYDIQTAEITRYNGEAYVNVLIGIHYTVADNEFAYSAAIELLVKV